MLNASAPKNETMRFLLHRIDSRGWKPVEDKENNRIIFESSTLETDLKEIQQKSQDDMRIINRFSALYIWAKKTFSRETIENQYNATLGEALSEATELISELNKDIENDFPPMYCGSLVTAATVFVRDYYSELTEEYSWCSSLILEIVKAKADSDDPSAAADATDHDGAAAAATVLPILLDFASNDEDKLMIIEAIVTALTHVNENVRLGAADGIREYLWEREPVFAHYCLIGAIEYARFEQSTLYDRRLTDFEEENYWEISRVKQKVKKDEFRQKFLRGECLIESSQITLQTHSSSHIIAPFSMIPYGSTEPEYVNLFSQMLGIVFELEKNKHKYHSDRDSELNIDYGFSLKFAKRFANYLFHLHHSNFFPYLELMREGCDIAPSFMSHFILFVAMDAEKKDMKEVFWSLWKELSQKVQEIAIAISDHDSNYDRDNGMELVRRMLMADIPWKRRDFENQEIAYGKDLILEFVTKAGQNQEVFEALARLIYYFQSIFFESGISILAKLQKENGGSSLFTGVNTAFYLESAIQRFLQVQNTGPVSRNLHQSCLILLDAIVETASSRAYYLREHLVRSRKIL